MMKPFKLKVLMVAEGDSWAGIESHLSNLIPHYLEDETMDLNVLLFAKGRFLSWLRSVDAKTIVINKSIFLITLFKVYMNIFRNRYDVIHTHSNVAFYIAVCLPFFRKTLWFNTQHGKPEVLVGIKGLKNYFIRFIVYSAIRHYRHAKIIAVSEELYHWLMLHKRVPKEKICVIRNGVYLQQGSYTQTIGLRESFELMENDFVITIVGRLVPVKGHFYLLNALKRISSVSSKSGGMIKLLVIGDGPLLHELITFCNINTLGSIVHFLGYRKDTRAIMAISNVIAIPSLHEGIPYTLLEAMWLGKPIIASKVGGLKEVLVDGKDAILFSPGNVDELKDAILSVVENPNYGERLGSEASKKVRQEYSSKRMAEETRIEYINSISRLLAFKKGVE